jgi:uncharacterized protein YjbI with pentapeptide repeats
VREANLSRRFTVRIVAKILALTKQQAKVIVSVAAGVVVGGVGSAVVLAAIPDANGVFHGCIRNNNDNLRIIDSATQTCGGGQTPITFNQTGPQGPAGPVGPAGPQGPAGSSGSVLLDDLAGADMSGAVMVGWDLSDQDFTGTNFTGATIATSDMTGATLTGAIFEGATLRGLNLAGFDLQNVLFKDVFLPNTSLANANLTGATFDVAQSGPTVNSPIVNATGANLTNGLIKRAIVRFDFSNANLTNVFFERSPALDEQATEISHVNFTNADFTGVEFSVGPGPLITMIESNFTGVDLSGATNIHTVVWQNTICPDGTNSDNNGDTCTGHLTP